ASVIDLVIFASLVCMYVGVVVIRKTLKQNFSPFWFTGLGLISSGFSLLLILGFAFASRISVIDDPVRTFIANSSFVGVVLSFVSLLLGVIAHRREKTKLSILSISLSSFAILVIVVIFAIAGGFPFLCVSNHGCGGGVDINPAPVWHP